MTIRAKLRLTTAISIGTVLGIGVTFFLSLQRLSAAEEKANRIQTLLKGETELGDTVSEYLTHHERRMYVQWVSQYGAMTSLLGSVAGDGDEEILVDETRESHKGMGAAFDLMIASTGRIRGETPASSETWTAPAMREMEAILGGQVMLQSQAVVSDLLRLSGHIRNDMVSAQQRLALTVVLSVLLLLAVNTSAYLTIMKGLVRPVDELRKGTEIVGAGDLDFRIGTDRKDEIGGLSRSFDAMAKMLQSITVRRDVLEAEVAERTRAEEALTRSEVRTRELNRLLRTISEINQTIVRIDDRTTLLREACRILVEHGGYRMAWFGFAEAASGRVVPEARAGEGLDFLDGVTERFDDAPDGRGPAGAAIRTGGRVVVADLATDPDFAPWSERHREHGFRSAGSFPFQIHGEVTGALTVYRGDPLVFSGEETALLDELAGDIGYALEVMEIRDENRRGEVALRLSEERFRIAAETANDAVYEWDLKQSVQWVGKIDEMLAYEPGEFPRTLDGWAALVHPEDLASTMAAVQAHLEGRAPYAAQYRVRRRDGVYRWWSARGAAARAPDGTPLRWIGSITDITEGKQADDALRESESRFRQLTESLPQLVWTCRPDGPCDYFNRQWIEFTGVPEAQQFGFGWLEQLHPDDRAPTVAAWEAAVASSVNFRVEFRIRRHDGEYRWFDTQAVRLRDAEGHTVKWFGSNTDITERKRAEDEIRALNEKLEERVRQRTAQLEASNKELEAFSYSVSHDLRAPLRAVDGFSRILLEDHAKQLDVEGKRLLDVVRSNTRRMGQLIDDLLSFSRIGRHEIARTDVDMEALAHAAFRDQLAVDETAFCTVGSLPHADADPSLMRQVWMNLLSNALKFTRPKAERAIGIAGRTEPGRVVYSVKDNGVGFDMAYSNKLFGVFQRLHSSAEFEGTGVGLALVQRIVNRHGGEVWAEGKVGEGATFSFSLPLPGGS